MQTPRIEIRHITRYQFDRMATILPHIIRLRPAPHCLTPIHNYRLDIEPAKHQANWQLDPFSNYALRVFFPEAANELKLTVSLQADIISINPFSFMLETEANHYPFSYETRLQENLSPYLKTSEHGALLRKWLTSINRSRCPSVMFLDSINKRLHAEITYLLREEHGVQDSETTLGKASGSCRDSAWLLIQILRHLGLASRFVSGYQVQLDAVDSKNPDKLTDKAGLHAWAEVFIPGGGWIGLDPTTGLFAAQGYIPLACTPDPESAAPVEGKTSPCEVTFSFDCSVRRLSEPAL